MSEKSVQNHIKSFLAFIFSIYIIFIAAYFIKYLAGVFFPECLPADLTEYFNLYVMDFRPETAEKLQYFLCAGMFPFVYAIFFKILQTVQINAGDKLYKTVILVEIALPVLLTALLCKNIDNDALNMLYLGIKSKAGAIFSIFSCLILMALYNFDLKRFFKPFKYIVNILMLIVVIAVFYTTANLYYTPTYDFSEASVMHFAAYFSPVYKVYSGLSAGVDFTNLYGFYPYFYNIVLKLFNNASVQFFSLINSILVCLSLLFVGITLFLNVKNKFLAFNFFLSYVFIYNWANIFSTHTLFFLQFMPHRVFFITMIAAFASIYLKIKNIILRNILKIMGYIISILAILWNAESGLIVLVCWTLFLLYEYVSLKVFENKPVNYKKIILIVSAAAASFLIYLTSIQLITFFRTGMWLDNASNFYYQTLFYKSGYYMLPMPLFKHPWMLVILVYLIALVKPVKALLLKKDDCNTVKNSLYLLLSLLGLGIFVYYQGRSYILNLVIVSFPALIILAMFCNDFIQKYLENKDNSFVSVSYLTRTVLILLPVLYFSVSAVYTVFLKNPAPYFNLLKTNTIQDGSCVNNVKFIKQNTQIDEKIDILTIDADTMYSMLNMKDSLKFNTFIDWSDKQQYRKVFDYLESSDNTLIMDVKVLDNLKKYESKKFEELFSKKRYEIYAQNKDLYIFKQNLNKK